MSTRFILLHSFLFSTLVAICTPAHGQLFGVRGGVQQTNLLTDEAANTFGTETGFTLGAFLNIPLPANLGISAEGMYAQKIVTQQNLDVAEGGEFSPDATLELGTIEIPITLAFRVPVNGPLHPRLYGGPLIGVVVNEKVDLEGKAVDDIANEAFVLTRDAFADREVGWLVGGGASLDLEALGMGSIHLLADIRYQSGITSITDDFAGNPLSQTIKVGAFTLLLGVGF